MRLSSDSFKDGAVIPGEFAFCVPAREGHVALSTNLNPHLAWADAPAGTRSFALICHDPDVPSRGDDVSCRGWISSTGCWWTCPPPPPPSPPAATPAP